MGDWKTLRRNFCWESLRWGKQAKLGISEVIFLIVGILKQLKYLKTPSGLDGSGTYTLCYVFTTLVKSGPNSQNSAYPSCQMLSCIV